MTKFNNLRDSLLTLMIILVGVAMIIVCMANASTSPNYCVLFGLVMFIIYMWLFDNVFGDIYMSATYTPPDRPEPGIPTYK